MKKFFFDDVRTAPGPDWVVAKDVAEAIVILQREQFDVMSLDHDIGMQMMCEECYAEIPKPITVETLPLFEDKLRTGCQHMLHGTDLAKWMVANLTEWGWPKIIIIHSANKYGADRMQAILSEHKKDVLILVIPFHAVQYDTMRYT